jgi:hypothetical protein
MDSKTRAGLVFAAKATKKGKPNKILNRTPQGLGKIKRIKSKATQTTLRIEGSNSFLLL